MEKKGQEKEDGHYLDLQSVATLVKQLPQAGESQKRKETESDENQNAKRVRNQKNNFQEPQPTFRPTFQQPQTTLRPTFQQSQPRFISTFQQPTPFSRPPPPYPFHSIVRVPHPHYGVPRPRMPHMPPPVHDSWRHRAPGPRPDNLGPAFYPDPGDDGWRMWR